MAYVHGYTDRESQRLLEQSLLLENLLHEGTFYPKGSRVLELGCGVGAQTRILSRRNPQAKIVALEISEDSITKARQIVQEEQLTNVEFIQDDLFEMPFDPESFDHVYVCFVLEHIKHPEKALAIIRDVLKPGGSITLIEGDHGSGFWTPETKESRLAWDGLIRSQKQLDHDPNIGRRIYPLLSGAGLSVQEVSPRWVYADQSHPELLDGYINQIIVPMVFSAEKQVLEEAYLNRETWKKGLNDIENVARDSEGSFFYTWFKGVGIKI